MNTQKSFPLNLNRNFPLTINKQKKTKKVKINKIKNWYCIGGEELAPNETPSPLLESERVTSVLKLRLHQASRETGQAGRLPAPWLEARSNFRQVHVRTWQATWSRQPAHLTCLSTCLM
jgi:hypothetical protein